MTGTSNIGKSSIVQQSFVGEGTSLSTPKATPQQKTPPKGDSSSSSTANNKSCFAELWKTICNFLRSICPCLFGRSKLEVPEPNKGAETGGSATKPLEPQSTIEPQKNPNAQLPASSASSAQGDIVEQLPEADKPAEEPSEPVRPDAVRMCLEKADSGKWFSSKECDDISRVQILLYFATNMIFIRGVIRFLILWTTVEDDKGHRLQLIKKGIGIDDLEKLTEDHKAKLIEFLEGHLKSLITRQLSEASAPAAQLPASPAPGDIVGQLPEAGTPAENPAPQPLALPASSAPSEIAQPLPEVDKSVEKPSEPVLPEKVKTFLSLSDTITAEHAQGARAFFFESAECTDVDRLQILLYLVQNPQQGGDIATIKNRLWDWINHGTRSGWVVNKTSLNKAAPLIRAVRGNPPPPGFSVDNIDEEHRPKLEIFLKGQLEGLGVK